MAKPTVLPPKLTSTALLSRNSNAIAKTYIDASRAGPVACQNCPWVQVGPVYSSITITGSESWLPLIQLLRERGRNNFVVYTGRHGDIVNKIDAQKKSYGILDHKHYDEDAELREFALEKLNGVGIELVDTSPWTHNHTATLKQHTEKQLKRGVGIIYAWCHSLFTFCETQLQENDKELERLRPNLCYNALHQIVAPVRWVNGQRNTKYDVQNTAYQRAKNVVLPPILARDEGPGGVYETASNKAVSNIVFRNWLWVPGA